MPAPADARNLSVACTLDPAALETRREGLLQELARQAEDHDELRDGYRLRFAASEEALTLIGRVINAERLCCRFLQFTLTVEPDEGPVQLDVTGPAGTREFLSALFTERRPTSLPHGTDSHPR